MADRPKIDPDDIPPSGIPGVPDNRNAGPRTDQPDVLTSSDIAEELERETLDDGAQRDPDVEERPFGAD